MQPIKNRQTVVDFTTQNAGDIESLFNVAEANGIGITDDVAPGTLLSVETTDNKVSGFYEGSELDITTTDKGAQPGGIGYMQIGSSFIIK